MSIEIGVVGYMTWWGVRLDGVALINLIMCIGFSVDFSAHICYHYLTAVSEVSLNYFVYFVYLLLSFPMDSIQQFVFTHG